MSKAAFDSIADVSGSVREKKLSPVEITQELLKRIEKYDSVLRSYITVMEETALKQAQELEKEIMDGNCRGPLHGVPIAIKDILQTQGTRTTCGSKIFADWIPDEDAEVVRRLKEAGAIIIGKANLHEFAMGATTENPNYGNCRNPWNPEKIPGGSSGGSAVCVAAGLAYGAIGTDTAGSIRLPAAVCGIVGIKPTYGRVSRHGCIPFSWSLDHIGPMTRTVRDAAIMLEAISGYDAKDQASKPSSPDMDYVRREDLRGVRLAVCREYFFEELDEQVRRVIERTLQRLEALGAEIREVSLPGLKDALQALKVIAQSEVLAFHEPILKKASHLYGEDLQYRFNFGSKLSATEYLNAQRKRNRFVRETLSVMEGYDALVAPTNSRPPFTIGTVPPHEAINNMFTLGKTPAANILGFPCLTVPCGWMEENLPVGLQMIGKPFAEKTLFEIAEVIEQSTGWPEKLRRNDAYVKAVEKQR